MDELEISGKRYISTRRAAREHGYHSDYMGQLIRGGKVAGQKVGRSWYIDEASLAVYLGKEAPVRPVALVPEIAEQPVPASAAEVESVQAVAEEVPAPEPMQTAPDIEKEIAPAEDTAPAIEEMKEEVPVVAVAVPVVEEPMVQGKPEPVQEEPSVYIEERAAPIEEVTRIPIHTPVSHLQEGGLRYAEDEAPLPITTRVTRRMHVSEHLEHPVQKSRFPIVSLSLVGILAIAAAAFASNFVTATVVSEPGKSAVVQYAIHW